MFKGFSSTEYFPQTPATFSSLSQPTSLNPEPPTCQPLLLGWWNVPIHIIWKNGLSPSLAPEVTQQLDNMFPNFGIASWDMSTSKRPKQMQMEAF